MISETHCPLCSGSAISSYCSDRRRSYLHCGTCKLVFVPRKWHLSRDAEKAEYELHENDVNDSGYRRFLSRLLVPLVARLVPGARGLDFGCGPEPALAHMLRESGFQVELYDSAFVADEEVFGASYDFICATEVVEHLHYPDCELERLWSHLKPGGWLGIMTKLVHDQKSFATWHYKNDPTHVCFYSKATWQWWAGERRARLEFIGADVILLQRQPGPDP